MYVQENLNPFKNDTGDCVIRAIALVEGQEWDDIFLDLMIDAFLKKLMIEDNRLWMDYLRRKGYKRYNIPDTCPDCYLVSDFVKDNPKGRFLVGTGTHLIGIIDGTLIDTWDSRGKVALFYFRKE